MKLRLSRFLARAGASSRRGAEDLVKAGRVRINGKPPVGLGDPIDTASDVVTLDGRRLAVTEPMWIAMHKPPGFVTSRAPTERHATVFSLLGHPPQALVSVGRLDVMSEGLLLFTTDGDLAARLMHPKWAVPRGYRVLITGELQPEQRRRLEQGIKLPDEDRPVKPLRWHYGKGEGGAALELDLGEGRSRVVRRLCSELGLGVRRLARLSYGPVELGGLGVGRSRALTATERAKLYAAVKLPEPTDD
jgi:23S rRNA pseudouridine2605 synthase